VRSQGAKRAGLVGEISTSRSTRDEPERSNSLDQAKRLLTSLLKRAGRDPLTALHQRVSQVREAVRKGRGGNQLGRALLVSVYDQLASYVSEPPAAPKAERMTPNLRQLILRVSGASFLKEELSRVLYAATRHIPVHEDVFAAGPRGASTAEPRVSPAQYDQLCEAIREVSCAYAGIQPLLPSLSPA
jgi:hypothetical protein